MKKKNLLFPLLFIAALTASAFTGKTAQKKTFGVAGVYQDPYGYCNDVYVMDPNCSPDILGPICYEYVMDDYGTGWAAIYQFGTGTICWAPCYSLYPNNP